MVRTARVEVVEFAYKGSEKTLVAGCNTDALGGNRVPASCRCIADRCAVWRWAPTTASVPTDTEGASGTSVCTWKTVPTQTVGYCGLAGRPEVAA